MRSNQRLFPEVSLPTSAGVAEVQRFTIFFAVVYFAQGLADLSAGLANQPLQYLLKDTLGLSATDSGFFWAVIGLGWTCKPLYGLLSDCLPFAGYHRKSYLIMMSTLGTGCWLFLSFFPPSYLLILIVLTLCAATLAFSDVMTDAVMVEVGRPLQLTGNFQAIQWASMSFALVLAQLGGGYLATYAAPRTVFLTTALFPLLTLAATLALIREPTTQASRQRVYDTFHALRYSAQSRILWLVVVFLFLWNFSPSLGTPLLYYQRDILHFSKVFIGTLGALSNAAGIVGAIVFFLYCRQISLTHLLTLAVLLGVISALGYLGLVGPKSAIVLALFFGFIWQITHLTVLDLAARTCPVGAEGTVFALLMSTLNLGKTGGTALGGWLYDHTGLQMLILVSAVFTALCGIVVPFLAAASQADPQRPS
ncbi:MAG: MFS transporter [Candidatus Binatia bacterium]